MICKVSVKKDSWSTWNDVASIQRTGDEQVDDELIRAGLESVKTRGRGVGGGASSGGRWYLHPQQLICKDVPKDGEEEEGDEGEDDDPPGALLLQTLLVAAQDEQPHADAHHRPGEVRHEAGLGAGRGQRRGEAEPDGAADLGAHWKDGRQRSE